MKACFYWGRRFVYLGNIMAQQLKEKYGINDFCAFVTLRSSYNYLKNQKEINYSQLLLEEDIYATYKNERLDLNYLAWLEKEYGIPNLWPYMALDRILRYNLYIRAYPSDTPKYTHEEMMRILQVTAKAIIKFFDEEKPDFIFFSALTNLSNLLLYEVARKKNIKTIVMYDNRLGNRFGLSDCYDTFDSLIEVFNKMSDQDEIIKEAQNFLTEFQNKPKYYIKKSEAASTYTENTSSALVQFKFLKFKNLGQSIGWFIKSHLDYFFDVNKDRNDYTTIKPWVEVWDKFIRKLRILRGFKDLYDIPVEGEDYVYFALHTEPESLPTLVAPFYKDQKWLITQVARSLPVHFKLYVKDHPRMVGLRSRSYYKDFKKIPNVKLIDPSLSAFSLAQNSKIVVTITGTAGWEALLLKKPVIIFGEIFYSKLSAVRVCRAIVDLPYLVKEQLESFIYNEKELVNFLTALYAESVMIDLVQIWQVEGSSNLEKKKIAITPLVDLLVKKLGHS